jgi:hypothetical protein
LSGHAEMCVVCACVCVHLAGMYELQLYLACTGVVYLTCLSAWHTVLMMLMGRLQHMQGLHSLRDDEKAVCTTARFCIA